MRAALRRDRAPREVERRKAAARLPGCAASCRAAEELTRCWRSSRASGRPGRSFAGIIRYRAGGGTPISDMRRREFITLIGGAAAAWPLAARAQQAGKSARIGVFAGAHNPVMAPAYRAFLDELRRAGFNEGQNLTVEQQPSDQDLPALSVQAATMVRANPDVLVALGSEPVLQACVAASRTIPIIFVANNYDPIARGYVRSLAKPGGNVTGIFLRQTELAEKQVELLTQAFPGRTRLAVLWDYISGDQFEAAERRAKLLRLEVHSHKFEHPPYAIDAAYRSIASAGSDILLVLSSPFFARHRGQIIEFAIRHRLPSMFIFKGYAEAGGLMSYGVDPVAVPARRDSCRQSSQGGQAD
jgi:putative tryptophan/tyrosine transport system substrate-binding protein